jgi:transcriptional regulator with XRE-family HTH domain
MFDKIAEYLNKPILPNKLTEYMGEQIRSARKDAFMSQAELAEGAYMRQAAISDIENGKREINASELMNICMALNKPASSLYPPIFRSLISPDQDISEKQKELLSLTRRIMDEDFERLLIIARAFHDASYRGDID